MSILTESKTCIIFHEYETVYIKFKKLDREILIGDFYGNPQMAVISSDETFCAVCGCGIIIYYLEEPFEEYEYNLQTSQWKEWGRIRGEEIWVDHITCTEDKILVLETENNELHKIIVM